MEILENLGLSKNEINVYLTLLKLGEASATEVSKLSGLKRSTTYDNLNSLKSRGFVSSNVEKNTAKFIATNPKNLLKLQKDILNDLEELVPDLEKIQSTAPKLTKSQFFEGKRSILILADDIIAEGKPISIIGPISKIRDVYSFHTDKFALNRVNNNIPAKLIRDYTEKGLFEESEVLTEVRYHKGILDTDVISFIYGSNVAFITTKGAPTGFIIKNDLVAKQQKILFDNLWKDSKE